MLDILGWIWCLLKSFFYWIIENLLTILDYILNMVLLILPNSPFNFEPLQWGTIGKSVGYFIPVATILNHFITILTAIAIYYSVRYLLRLIKAIQ